MTRSRIRGERSVVICEDFRLLRMSNVSRVGHADDIYRAQQYWVRNDAWYSRADGRPWMILPRSVRLGDP